MDFVDFAPRYELNPGFWAQVSVVPNPVFAPLQATRRAF